MMGKWTQKETECFIKDYPFTSNKELSIKYNRSIGSIDQKRSHLKLKKDSRYLSECNRKRQLDYQSTHPHQRLGKKDTEETKKKISEAHKGLKTWNTGLTRIELLKHYKLGFNTPTLKGPDNPRYKEVPLLKCKECGKSYRKRLSMMSYSKFCCKRCKLNYYSKSHSGSGNPNWMGGITAKTQRDRGTRKYDLWRTSVFIRDKYTCRVCNTIGRKLVAHHIKRWSDYEKLRYNVHNGITLCKSCHDKTINKERKFEKLFEKMIKNGK